MQNIINDLENKPEKNKIISYKNIVFKSDLIKKNIFLIKKVSKIMYNIFFIERI